MELSVRGALEEFGGCVVAACLSAGAFFLPYALKLEHADAVCLVAFFLTVVVYEKMGLRSVLNPANHLQKFLMRPSLKMFVQFAIGSALDLAGYVVGNAVSLWALQLVDNGVSFFPQAPPCSYLEVLVVEGLIFFVLQWFAVRGSKSLVIQALFCTLVVFIFLEVTGSYSSPAAFYSKVVVSGADLLQPDFSAYLFGPFIGSALAIPLLFPSSSTNRNAAITLAHSRHDTKLKRS